MLKWFYVSSNENSDFEIMKILLKYIAYYEQSDWPTWDFYFFRHSSFHHLVYYLNRIYHIIIYLWYQVTQMWPAMTFRSDILMWKQCSRGNQVRDFILMWIRNISPSLYLIVYLTTLSLWVATNNILGYKTPLFVLDFSQYVRMELTQCIRYAEIENRTVRLHFRIFATRI